MSPLLASQRRTLGLIVISIGLLLIAPLYLSFLALFLFILQGFCGFALNALRPIGDWLVEHHLASPDRDEPISFIANMSALLLFMPGSFVLMIGIVLRFGKRGREGDNPTV